MSSASAIWHEREILDFFNSNWIYFRNLNILHINWSRKTKNFNNIHDVAVNFKSLISSPPHLEHEHDDGILKCLINL